MKLIIDIPDTLYESIQACKNIEDTGEVTVEKVLIKAVENGTPLPKGHGRLIDADVLGEKLNRYTEAPYRYALAVFNESPTIIEAVKAESEE